MRDDVKKLFEDLFLLTVKKLQIIEGLIKREAQKKFCLDTDKIDELSDLIEKDGAIIEEINSIDFDIRKTEDEICRIIGIGRDYMPAFLEKGKEKILVDIKKKRIELNGLLKKLAKGMDDLSEGMNLKLKDLDKNIKSISNIRKLKGLLPPR